MQGDFSRLRKGLEQRFVVRVALAGHQVIDIENNNQPITDGYMSREQADSLVERMNNPVISLGTYEGGE